MVVQGSVCSERPDGTLEGVAGVRVSNGREVVVTDAAGRFALPRRPEDRFVFVTVPAGFAAVGSFYRDLTRDEPCDFRLRPDPAGLDTDFAFVQVTDIHISVGARTRAEDFAADLAQICEEVGDEARFIVVTGDLTESGKPEEFAHYLEAARTSRLPLWHGIGNHDDNTPGRTHGLTGARGEAQAPGQVQAPGQAPVPAPGASAGPVEDGTNYMDAVGPPYYSFDYGPLHFVMCDAVGSAWRNPDHQNAWLHADLRAAGRPTVILHHYPVGSEFYDPLKAYPIIATLSGHWHSSRVYRDGGTIHYNTPSLCFGGIDESPRGYRLCRYRNGVLTTTFRALGTKRSFRGIGAMPHPENEAGRVERFAGDPPRPAADWALLGGDPRRTGAAAAGPKPPLRPAWRTGTGGGILRASPIVAEGRVFVAVKREDQADGNAILALDAARGDVLWTYPTETAVKLAPAYAAGRLYAVTVTGRVVALDAACGGEIWSHQLGDRTQRWVYMSPLVHNGCVFVGTPPHFAALDAESGAPRWTRTGLGRTDWIASYPSPAGYGPYVIVAFHGQKLHLAVLESESGRTVWALERPGSVRMNATPVVGPDGTVYTVSGGNEVRAFDLETGTAKWTVELKKARCGSAPALGRDRLYVPSGVGTLHALDARDGTVQWVWTGGEGLASFTPFVRGGKGVVGSPAVAGETVYVGCADGGLYALDAVTGAEVWRYDLGAPTLSAPEVSGTGLWTCSCDGFVYAFSEAGSETGSKQVRSGIGSGIGKDTL